MTTLYAKGKTLLTLGVGFCAAVGILSLTHLGPVSASVSPGVNLSALVAQVSTLQTQQATDEATITALKRTVSDDEATIARLKGTPIPGPQGPAGPKGDKGDTGEQGPAGVGAISALTQTGSDVYFTGVNVHIVDGTGSTNSASGRGNLTIGYNALGNYNGDVRTGSHNLILGDQNNYSSYGGLVAGQHNAISGQYASVSGGQYNTASSQYASVSGGAENTASGTWSFVSGGFQNTASAPFASVSGGYNHTQSAAYGWSGGGYHSP